MLCEIRIEIEEKYIANTEDITRDGIIGNYSGVGGKTTKEWLLSHERIEYEN